MYCSFVIAYAIINTFLTASLLTVKNKNLYIDRLVLLNRMESLKLTRPHLHFGCHHMLLLLEYQCHMHLAINYTTFHRDLKLQ